VVGDARRQRVRFASADAVTGPWTIHDAGVLHVKDTAFFREQPDPVETRADFYTHVASPEILIDHERRRIVMWVHGWWTSGERWPACTLGYATPANTLATCVASTL